MESETCSNAQSGSLGHNQRGTKETLIGVDNAFNVLFGDALDMHDKARVATTS